MFNTFIKRFSYGITLTIILLLSACSSNHFQQSFPLNKAPSNQQTIQQRNQQMQQLLHWRIKGKIAFIEKNNTAKSKRKSASLRWSYQKNSDTNKDNNIKQQIDLTTFMGINILHVESNNQRHMIKVNGENYYGDDLNKMIYALTGLNLPTQALTYWLKGLAYNKHDKIIYDDITHLPKSLTSTFLPYVTNSHKKQRWQVNYAKYKNFSDYKLATKLTIIHHNLTIKIAINSWSIL